MSSKSNSDGMASTGVGIPIGNDGPDWMETVNSLQSGESLFGKPAFDQVDTPVERATLCVDGSAHDFIGSIEHVVIDDYYQIEGFKRTCTKCGMTHTLPGDAQKDLCGEHHLIARAAQGWIGLCSCGSSAVTEGKPYSCQHNKTWDEYCKEGQPGWTAFQGPWAPPCPTEQWRCLAADQDICGCGHSWSLERPKTKAT